jgi:hypothetical protein
MDNNKVLLYYDMNLKIPLDPLKRETQIMIY